MSVLTQGFLVSVAIAIPVCVAWRVFLGHW